MVTTNDTVSAPTEQLGRVVVAQSVLTAIVEMTALKVPGVVRTAPHNRRTVHVTVEGNAVHADVGIVVAIGANVADVSATVRRRVAAAIERLLGMEAKEVNVFVQDVEGGFTRHDSATEAEKDKGV